MGKFWPSSVKDTAKNGMTSFAILGVLFVTGMLDQLVVFLEENLPAGLMVLGEFSIPVYIVGVFAIIGYGIDKW